MYFAVYTLYSQLQGWKSKLKTFKFPEVGNFAISVWKTGGRVSILGITISFVCLKEILSHNIKITATKLILRNTFSSYSIEFSSEEMETRKLIECSFVSHFWPSSKLHIFCCFSSLVIILFQHLSLIRDSGSFVYLNCQLLPCYELLRNF